MLLIIDNYDSFTYNLVQYFGELGQEVVVYRNDQITLSQITTLNPKYLVISPGPCTPNEAGISMAAITEFAGKMPILGVCLGFQAIVQAYGGVITRAKEIMHGKVSAIYHNNTSIFTGIDLPFQATRYHSLIADQTTLPDCFEITAWTEKQSKLDEIMAVKHTTLAIEGVQFHPESILTDFGQKILQQFLIQYTL